MAVELDDQREPSLDGVERERAAVGDLIAGNGGEKLRLMGAPMKANECANAPAVGFPAAEHARLAVKAGEVELAAELVVITDGKAEPMAERDVEAAVFAVQPRF